ncbi:Protein of unknown function (DUF2567) [Streptoalloteichus tenebrarius]|uniref:DUF2567 domain-containing protein n=1 Tax=Streptoalloteichus tenebrarius (strain ATCC 17920 / DSM 40477 / JCM 4838 / CBS 697.72 / NBRC 16177 / NCIMB 11028 / NRRL B-12390 / A12253. 1 / ISP 5477) TaxID=1933 RepID=A0ABT1HNC2_STRSD|nr:DUF2567 domain-containing protein [Streptoalloteichus tenebrarius]MCP2256993.1 Protein of unknown function (DUF2567) [Streptoalloteichus tenebrarius]BFF00096.1 DUF2567 domain-containing protein [Streptoalloteichus tenebrarius]
MPEQPVGSPESRVESDGVVPAERGPEALPPAEWHHARPRVVVRRDLMPAVSVLSTVALVGLPVGWLWSRLAPPQQVRVVQGERLAPLPLESYHRFDDLAVFLLLTLAVGLVTGGAVWLLRQRRGPVVMLAAALGSLVAAWLALRTGLSFAEGLYPLGDLHRVGALLWDPPRLESGWVVLAQPLAALLAYGACAAWNGHDDLGRRLG